MKYGTRKEFLSYIEFMENLGFLKEIGTGSQGVCYLNLFNNKVYKIYHQFFDDNKEYDVEYKKEEAMGVYDKKEEIPAAEEVQA